MEELPLPECETCVFNENGKCRIWPEWHLDYVKQKGECPFYTRR